MSPLLFGQFLERLNVGKKGESGPEAALIGETSHLQPGVLEALAELNPSIIRFPGGMVVPGLIDWTVMLDHSPFRDEAGRVEGYEYGWEEFFRLCEYLDAEPLVVTSFRPAVWGVDPPLSPAEMAAGMVAYCNAPLGADLPEGMPDWPALRAKNGHPKPHDVTYFQIGNEWVAWLKGTYRVRERLDHSVPEDEAAFIALVKEKLLEMIAAMRAIDPDIKIIVDAVTWDDEHLPWFEAWLSDPEIKAAADFAAVHIYRPWAVDGFQLDGEEVDVDLLSANQIWHAVVASPNIDADGLSILKSESWSLARDNDWPVVLTEWNWNGWGVERHGAELWARGLGVAGFLHAMLREAEHIELATQSMMVGDTWMITGVRADPSGEAEPFVLPSGRVTGFYAEHSGDQFVPVEIEGAPKAERRVSMGSLRRSAPVSLIDAVATADADTIYLHLINRDQNNPQTVRLDFADPAPEQAILYRMTGKSLDTDKPFVSPGQYKEKAEAIALESTLELPAASITILEIAR
ncbi:MAG: hypothetical protein ACOCVG_04890 [Verrucomicrobiota bacterium]